MSEKGRESMLYPTQTTCSVDPLAPLELSLSSQLRYKNLPVCSQNAHSQSLPHQMLGRETLISKLFRVHICLVPSH